MVLVLKDRHPKGQQLGVRQAFYLPNDKSPDWVTHLDKRVDYWHLNRLCQAFNGGTPAATPLFGGTQNVDHYCWLIGRIVFGKRLY
jgi:hypothetical protein